MRLVCRRRHKTHRIKSRGEIFENFNPAEKCFALIKSVPPNKRVFSPESGYIKSIIAERFDGNLHADAVCRIVQMNVPRAVAPFDRTGLVDFQTPQKIDFIAARTERAAR